MALRETTIAPSCPFGLENTKSVRKATPMNFTDCEPCLREPSIGSPRPGISTPLPPVGAGVGVAPDDVGAGLSDVVGALGGAVVGAGGSLGAPPLFSGPMGGIPADSNASLMSPTRLA